jgi:putative DNA primase/helicase
MSALPAVLDLPVHDAAERSLLGAVLVDGSLLLRLDNLRPDHFAVEAHGLVFTAIRALADRGESVDLVTVQSELERTGRLERAGGAAVLSSLVDRVPDVENVESYGRAVRDASRRRRLIFDLVRQHAALAAGAPVEDVAANLGRVLGAVTAPAESGIETDEPGALTIPELLAKAFRPREMLLPPWLSSKSIALLYGPRGIGKSRFIHAAGLSLSCGIEIIPGWRPARRARVLLVDGELPGVELQRRFASLVAAYGAEPGDYLRVVVADDLPHGLPSLTSPPGQKIVEDLLGDAELLILDNVSTLLPSADENDSAAWQPAQDFLLHLRRRGVSTCLLHHSNKTGGQRGTSRREDVVDTVLALRTPEDADESDGSRFMVVFEKHRGFHGKDALPFVAELDGMKWRRSAPEETRLAIVERLTKAGSSVRAIAEEMSIPKSTIHRLIARSKGGSK